MFIVTFPWISLNLPSYNQNTIFPKWLGQCLYHLNWETKVNITNDIMEIFFLNGVVKEGYFPLNFFFSKTHNFSFNMKKPLTNVDWKTFYRIPSQYFLRLWRWWKRKKETVTDQRRLGRPDKGMFDNMGRILEEKSDIMENWNPNKSWNLFNSNINASYLVLMNVQWWYANRETGLHGHPF